MLFILAWMVCESSGFLRLLHTCSSLSTLCCRDSADLCSSWEILSCWKMCDAGIRYEARSKRAHIISIIRRFFLVLL